MGQTYAIAIACMGPNCPCDGRFRNMGRNAMEAPETESANLEFSGVLPMTTLV
jgi:hypothetical protein